MEICNIVSVIIQCNTATIKTFNQLFFMDELIKRTCAKEENQQECAIIGMACPLQLINLLERFILEIQEVREKLTD